MPRSVVVLDLDGVIIKSNFIKFRAMLSLFSAYPDQQPRISEYILARGGIPRHEKIGGILCDIIGVSGSPDLLAGYLQRYAVALEQELAIEPLVEGVADFLALGSYHFYVSSSAPEAEVQAQLVRRDLYTHFAGVYGADMPKAEALRQVVRHHPAATVVFFGDSVADLQAAQEANVAFVAVINERDNFPGHSVVKLRDFSSPPLVQRCIQSA